jgi:hypothetical protein
MERSIGFLEGVSGHTYDIIYDLLFTTERVITLNVHHPSEVSYNFGVKELLLGGLLTKQRERFDKNKFAEERLRAYEEKGFDALLAGHRFNFEIPYQEVNSVEVTRSWFQTRLKFQLNGSSITGATLYFTLTKDQVSETQKLIKLALPLKFKGK